MDVQLIHDGARMKNLGELGNLVEINEKQENSFLAKQVIKDNEHTLIEGQRSERTEVLRQGGQGIISDASRLELKIEKIVVPWKQINAVVGASNLELIENDMVFENRAVQSKPCRSLL